jgi:hypothetical protein
MDALPSSEECRTIIRRADWSGGNLLSVCKGCRLASTTLGNQLGEFLRYTSIFALQQEEEAEIAR